MQGAVAEDEGVQFKQLSCLILFYARRLIGYTPTFYARSLGTPWGEGVNGTAVLLFNFFLCVLCVSAVKTGFGQTSDTRQSTRH